ncbi:MAG: hypothetical protein KDE14_00595 [Rhodobacteraceae bacterium]|nr:hypothetical protein [Paracoccaceae bacterium]
MNFLQKTTGDFWTRGYALLSKAGERNLTPSQARTIFIGAGCLVWVLVTFTLSNEIDGLQTRLKNIQFEIGRLTALAKDSNWDARLQQSQSMRQVQERRLWSAPTPGLGEASFEAWLRDRFQTHGLNVQQIILARTPLDSNEPAGAGFLAGTERMTAKVISDFKPRGTINVTADVATSDKLLTIDHMVVRTGRNARLETDISTYFRVE